MAYLFFDVLTYILDQLDQVEDVETLRSISLCCSDLRPCSQRRIFHTVDLKHCLRTRQTINQMLRLHAVLESSPCLADYVRSFEFSLHPEDAVPGHVSSVATLCMILSKLHHIKALVWEAIRHIVNWDAFCTNAVFRDLSRAILGVLPNLTFLKIDRIQRFPLNQMTIRNVLLDVTEDSWISISLAVIPDNDLNRNDTTNYFRIRNYDIGHIGWPRELQQYGIEGGHRLHSLDPPFIPFDFSNLQSLRVAWQGSSVSKPIKDTEKIMNCASMLKEFTCSVSPGGDFNGLSRLILAHASQSLTILNVEITRAVYSDHPSAEGARIESCCRELSALGGQNRLERISISIELPADTWGMYEQDLQAIDATISRDMFRSLKTVDILINILKSPGFSPRNFGSNQEFCSTGEFESCLEHVYGGYCEALQTMEDLVFSYNVAIK